MGFVKVRKDGELKPCVVLGSTFPSWLPVLRELGFEPVLILLRSDVYLEEVEAFVRDKCVIWCGSDWEAFGTAVPHFSGRDCQGFVDSVTYTHRGLGFDTRLSQLLSTDLSL
jgi:hypothetical protein